MGDLYKLTEKVSQAIKDGSIGFFLDLDGATIHRPPAISNPVMPEVGLDAMFLKLLKDGAKIAINTGRPQIFVENVFPLTMASLGKDPNLWVSTENGACVRGPNYFERISGLSNVGKLREAFGKAVDEWPGTVLEDHKMFSMTLSVAKAQEKEAAYNSIMREAKRVSELTREFHVIGGLTETDGYIEFVNPVANKGMATQIICDRSDPEGKTVFFAFGDSNADHPMLEEIKNRGGFTVGVGIRAPDNADYYVHNYHTTQEIIMRAALG